MDPLTWFILKFIRSVGRFLAFLILPVFRWFYNGAHHGLASVHSDLLMKSGVELAAMIRKRQV